MVVSLFASIGRAHKRSYVGMRLDMRRKRVRTGESLAAAWLQHRVRSTQITVSKSVAAYHLLGKRMVVLRYEFAGDCTSCDVL